MSGASCDTRECGIMQLLRCFSLQFTINVATGFLVCTV